MTSIRRVLPGILLLTQAAVAGGQTTPATQPSGFIEVNGSGIVQVTPDRARLTFAVETQATAAGEASAQNARRMDAVIRALRSLGVRDLVVETFGYSLRPDYSTTPTDAMRARTIAGYTALNNIRVTVSDVGAVGKVMDKAIEAGANRVSGLAFEASDTEDARREALTLAVSRARAQAEAMAAALGRELGEPLEVRGGAESPSPRPPYAMAMAMEARGADTPVEAGDLNVVASVSIRFALGGPAGGL